MIVNMHSLGHKMRRKEGERGEGRGKEREGGRETDR